MISWTTEGAINDLQFAIYRFEKNEQVDILESKHLLDIVRGNQYILPPNSGGFKYVVTALNRLHVESSASNSVN
jgi:hypothetical protein